MENEESKTWAMVGGDGPRSYAQNSSYQRGLVDVANESMSEGIKDKLEFKNPCFDSSNICTFRIADFGCSVGPNTFVAVEKIIEAVEQKYRAQFRTPRPWSSRFSSTMSLPMISTLLESKLLSWINGCRRVDECTSSAIILCSLISENNLLCSSIQQTQNFAAGVPGTFYGRLLPKSTLHLAYSSYSLHWLSRVPDEVVDSKSPAWNKGSIQCSGTAKQVAKAYSAQFKGIWITF